MGRKQHKRARSALIFNDRPRKRESTVSIPTAVQSVCKVIGPKRSYKSTDSPWQNQDTFSLAPARDERAYVAFGFLKTCPSQGPALTSTMPANTGMAPIKKPASMGSPNNQPPKSMPNKGVMNENTPRRDAK